MLEEKPAHHPLEPVALKHTGWMPPAYLLFKGGDTNSDDGDSVQATMTMLYYDKG
jgi:hypothetical protein